MFFKIMQIRWANPYSMGKFLSQGLTDLRLIRQIIEGCFLWSPNDTLVGWAIW